MKYVLILIALILTSCTAGANLKSKASGQPYQILIVASKTIWQSSVGDSLRAVFCEPIPVSNQEEPHFDVVNVDHRNFIEMLKGERNILDIKINQGDTQLIIKRNVHSQGQLYVTLTAPDTLSLVSFIDENRVKLLHIFENEEFSRQMTANIANGHDSISKLICAQFGIVMDIPREFAVVRHDDNLLVINHHTKTATRGMAIYQNAEIDDIMRKIPQSVKGTFMKIDTTMMPIVENGVSRGFWSTSGAFAGGVWAQLRVPNDSTAILWYIYCPSFNESKRNLMYSLEAIARSAKR